MWTSRATNPCIKSNSISRLFKQIFYTKDTQAQRFLKNLCACVSLVYYSFKSFFSSLGEFGFAKIESGMALLNSTVS